MTRLERATAIARDVRAYLLRLDKSPSRNLAGQCGIASMLMASALNNPQALRVGFYMKYETLCGKRGRYPYRHAWCRVGTMIVDVTATQFDQRNRAVHVAKFDEDTRYIETADSDDALDDIMGNWRGCELPAYVKLAKGLRRLQRV